MNCLTSWTIDGQVRWAAGCATLAEYAMRRWPASEVSAIPSANRGIRWQRRDTSAEEVFFEFCWPAAVVQCFPIRCPPKEVRVTIKVLVGRGRAAERLRRTACELAADFLWAMRGRLCGPLVSTRPQTANRPALPLLRWLVRLLSMMYVARFSGVAFSLSSKFPFKVKSMGRDAAGWIGAAAAVVGSAVSASGSMHSSFFNFDLGRPVREFWKGFRLANLLEAVSGCSVAQPADNKFSTDDTICVCFGLY